MFLGSLVFFIGDCVVTRDEYLSRVGEILRRHFRPDDPSGGMTAASFAFTVRRELGVSHSDVGFFKFKDVLSSLEDRSELKLGTNSKGAFAVWLPRESNTVPSIRLGTKRPNRPLRSEVWFAFISNTPERRRFFNRDTGEILLSSTVPSDDGQWDEITPIDQSTEKEIARQFVLDKQLELPELESLLAAKRWYTEFSQALSKVNVSLAKEWNRERSKRITAVIQAWCERHTFPNKWLFVDYDSRECRQTPEARGERETNSANLRDALLQIITSLPTDELLSMRLEIRDVLAVIKPELLD